jgi:hypothetical protein
MKKLAVLVALAGVILLGGCRQNQPPLIRLKTDPDPVIGAAPLKVTFDATRTVDPEGGLIRFYWLWQEGGRRIIVGGPKIIHIFRESVEVILMVMDDYRNIATKTISIVVR